MKQNPQSKTITLFLETGTPNGVVKADDPSSNCQIAAAPRNQLRQLLGQKKYQKPGAYLLKGEPEEDLTLYVGKTNNFSDRIKNHDSKKDWWTHCCLINSKDKWLNSADAGYLEHHLYQLAKSNGQVRLTNENEPSSPDIAEDRAVVAENFLQAALLIFPLLEFNFFYDSTSTPKDASIPIFKLETKKVEATARLQGDKWIVLKGSFADLTAASYLEKDYPGYYKRRERLIENDILKKQGDMLVFTQDAPFNSPSTAASIIIGKPSNGRQTWKAQEKGKAYSQWQTYGEWEDSRPES